MFESIYKNRKKNINLLQKAYGDKKVENYILKKL